MRSTPDNNRKIHISKFFPGYLISAIATILFFIPFFSYSGFSVGGDDSRLYYLYPGEYLKNYLLSMGSGNVLGGFMGYTGTIFMTPIIALVSFVKTIVPLVNVQHIFYGLNLSLGFLFCFLFFRTFDRTKNSMHLPAAILASCLYITSAYLARTLFQSELIVMYLVTLVPLLFYTFTRGLEEKNIKYIVGSAISFAVLSSSLSSSPWLIPLFLVCTPYFVHCAFHYRSFFWKSMLVFIVVSVGLNWFWLVHSLLSILSSRLDAALGSVVVSGQFIRTAENDMISSTFLNGPMHQIAGYLRTSWQDNRPMPSWNLIGCTALFLVTVAGMKLKNAAKYLQMLFGVVLFSLCIALFMITPNMGMWNMDVFLFLNRTVPFFSMFRNMYDKFGLAMAFASAWIVFLSLMILTQTKHKAWRWIPMGLGIILLLYQLPLFLGIQGIGRPKSALTALSSEYLQMTKTISSLDTTKRFVWYPMTFPGYTPIQDEMRKDIWYLGISPLRSLSGKSDITGFYELQTNAEPNRSWTILELFKQKNYAEILSILASYNIGYVITVNGKLPDAVEKQLDLFSFMTLQTEEYRNTLLGSKLYDFGMYSIYSINPEYAFPTAFLTNNTVDIRSPKQEVAFRQTKTNTYEVMMSPENDFQSLVLLVPYHVLWNVSLPKAGEGNISVTNHRAAYEYGNAWDIQWKENSVTPVTLTVTFIPDRFTIPSVAVSVLVLIGCVVYLWYPKKRT